jgi:hypothetical protein
VQYWQISSCSVLEQGHAVQYSQGLTSLILFSISRPCAHLTIHHALAAWLTIYPLQGRAAQWSSYPCSVFVIGRTSPFLKTQSSFPIYSMDMGKLYDTQANYSQSWPWVLYEPACYMNSLSALSQPAFKPQLSHFLLCSIKTFLLVRMTVIITWLPNPVLLLKVANKDWMSSWNIHFQW